MAKPTTTIKDNAYYKSKFWKIYFYSLASLFLFFIFASWGIFGSMPSFEDLEDPNSNLATEIISADGVTLGKFYNENRTPVKFEEIPKTLVQALVATEDERFFEHSGIDARRTFGAVAKMGTNGGASTLTQQLAKLLFHGEGSRFLPFRIVQKAKEWIIAIKLERQYTKNEIIAMYFNKADFVNTAVGIRSAAKVYFGKKTNELSIDEGAMLVGMLTNPSYFNPVRRPERVKTRRNIVLGQMLRNKIITTSQKESLEKKPIELKFQPEGHLDGMATYFREFLRDYMKTWIKEHKKPDGSDYDIYRDGLKIYTTIDSHIQEHAEAAVTAHLKNLQEEFFSQAKNNKNAPFLDLTTQETNLLMNRARKASERWRVLKEQGKSNAEIIKSFDIKTKMRVFTWKGEEEKQMTPNDSIRYYKHFLQSGLMSMEPQTGQVKAWVGGINYKYFQYDHVNLGTRQVGSTFKPFVYATAIEQLGMSPCDYVQDSPFTMPKGRYGIPESWSPKNSDNKYRGSISLKKALANSVNVVSAKLIDRTGPKAVVTLAKKLGIQGEIPINPSIALGAVEISVQDMVAAYSTFANQGVYMKPQFITKIEDKNGVIIYQPIPESHDVLNPEIAYAVIKLLEGVTEGGSGDRLRTEGGGAGYNRVTGYPYAFKNPIAGKTGTTQNQSDGWFMGIVPNLVTGVWVGCEDRSARFKSITYGQGATAALPIWGYFMKKCYADPNLKISHEDFIRPEELSINVDCEGSGGGSGKPTEPKDTDEFGL